MYATTSTRLSFIAQQFECMWRRRQKKKKKKKVDFVQERLGSRHRQVTLRHSHTHTHTRHAAAPWSHRIENKIHAIFAVNHGRVYRSFSFELICKLAGWCAMCSRYYCIECDLYSIYNNWQWYGTRISRVFDWSIDRKAFIAISVW